LYNKIHTQTSENEPCHVTMHQNAYQVAWRVRQHGRSVLLYEQAFYHPT